MNPRIEARVKEHGEDLKHLFHLPAETDPVSLCRKLRRLEREAEAIALQGCNGPEFAEGEEDERIAAVLAKLEKVLGFRRQGIPVFFNGDPRGYALKIDDGWLRESGEHQLYRDWGGYGILAPDLTEG
jgi:hypothetical protein